jgi:hypothetical protein
LCFLYFQDISYALEDQPNGYSRFPNKSSENMKTFYDENTATWETHL